MKSAPQSTTPESIKAVTHHTANLDDEAVAEISAALRLLLADAFALCLKTKNFHWHMSGPHFRDYHLLLDEHAEQIFSHHGRRRSIRARKLGVPRSVRSADIVRHQRLHDNDAAFVDPEFMLLELCADNQHLTASLRAAHELCAGHNDVATTSMIEVWIDQAELTRKEFLSEITRGH